MSEKLTLEAAVLDAKLQVSLVKKKMSSGYMK